jgi:hypothetical protein
MKRLAVLLLICLLSSGCFVFDEIDAGKAQMDKNSPKPKAPPPGPDAKAGGKATAQARAKAGTPGHKAGKDWWATAKSIDAPTDVDPGDPNTPVSCQVRGSTRFMRRGDCLSQGGRPAR